MSILSKMGGRAVLVKGVPVAVIVVSLLVLVRALPVNQAVEAFKSQADALGFWGPVAFGAAYVFAALAFLPGSAFTLAAGAVFGLLWGTITVSIASTTAAALAFLIARYVAREKVARQAQAFPKFQAIDRAIGEGGWKIIAMLRLSPAIPFSLGNYLFGLTPVRFWHYVLASWIFMLPGTFLYVYLGLIGTEGLQSAAGAEQGKSPGEWAMLGVGLLATVAVTIYVTRLARKALHQQTDIDSTGQGAADSGNQDPKPPSDAKPSPWKAVVLPVIAIVMLAVAACAHQNRVSLASLFGPVKVTLREAYEKRSDGPKFDHSAFDTLLRKHVDGDGWVNYEGLQGDLTALDSYIASLENAPFAELGRDEKLALLINGYNAFTLRLIFDHYPVESIKDIPSAERWDAKRWRIGPMTLSLNQIEHEQIRPKFKEPRVHFALVCAAIGCPTLRFEAYQAAQIDEQLEDQTRYVHSHDRWFRYEASAKEVSLTKLYDWYGSDFEQVAGSALEFAARYSKALGAAFEEDAKPRIKWLEYDWRLNDRRNKP